MHVLKRVLKVNFQDLFKSSYIYNGYQISVIQASIVWYFERLQHFRPIAQNSENTSTVLTLPDIKFYTKRTRHLSITLGFG